MAKMVKERVRRPRRFTAQPGDRISFGGAVYVISMDSETGEPYVYDESDPFYSPENQARLRQSIAEIEAGHYTEHELIRV